MLECWPGITPSLHHSTTPLPMALQDLTPQLRTRLSRMERAVGWFVTLALALLVFGFVYYVYHTAERKGWFLTKAPYYTYTDRATGLKLGDPVMLMGLDVGQITQIEPMPAEEFEHNIYVEFEIKDPYYDYLWTRGLAGQSGHRRSAGQTRARGHQRHGRLPDLHLPPVARGEPLLRRKAGRICPNGCWRRKSGTRRAPTCWPMPKRR